MKKVQNDLTPPRRLVPNLSERVEWAILRAMSADPKNRPETCREFIEDVTGHSTRRVSTEELAAAADLWFLVYRDDEGEQHTVKGSTAAIRRSLRDGLLGDAGNVRASRSKTGPFEQLRTHPEFRDMVVSAARLALAPSTTSRAAVPTPPESKPAQVPTPQGLDRRDKPAGSSSPPRINLGATPGEPSAPLDWAKWLVMLGVALATALGVYFLLRWW
jgi:hypothetical protein